jgi:hypothetical protein
MYTNAVANLDIACARHRGTWSHFTLGFSPFLISYPPRSPHSNCTLLSEFIYLAKCKSYPSHFLAFTSGTVRPG